MDNIYDIFPKTCTFPVGGFSLLPKEIWITIILEIPCKFIPKLYDVTHQFKELCVKENIIEKRKMRGYPRTTGHCESYGVYNYKGNAYDPKGNIIYNGFVKVIMRAIRYDNAHVRLLLDDTLDELYKDNINLVRGDLVNFEIGNGSIFLFDGEKIIDTYRGDDTIILDDFDIINDNIPTGYWRGTGFSCKFFFNIILIKEQLMNNIVLNDGMISHMLLLLNNRKYTIMMSEIVSMSEIKSILINDKISLSIIGMCGINNDIFLYSCN